MTQHDRDLRHISFEGRPAPTGRYGPVPPLKPVDCRLGLPGNAARLPATIHRSDRLARWVLDRAGLDAHAYRADSLRRRIPACLRALKVHSEDEARLLLVRRTDLLAAAVSALLIGVTEFFRDADVFVTLQNTVVPALAGLRRAPRVWSAGCASGAELYGFATLLAEAGLLDGAELLGTDCRPDVIHEARTAVFEVGQARAIGERLFDKYFEASGGGTCRPIPRLHLRAQWKRSDFLDDAERGPWDVIFWRNAAIYLSPEATALVCRRLIAELSPDGFLVLGKAERPPAGLPVTPVRRCVYQKRPDRQERA